MVEKTLRLPDLPALCMALSNTFALSVGIILMGYGLVELPRELWKSDPNHLLKWCAHRYETACAGQRSLSHLIDDVGTSCGAVLTL